MLNEKMSAWLDGELDESEAEHLAASVLRQSGMRQTCDVAWMIGDVLREEPVVSADFSSRVMAALAAEPVVFAPASIPRRALPAERKQPPRWMALAASAAGVAVVGWLAFSQSGTESGVPVAAVVAKAKTEAAQQQLARSPRSEDEAYMMAHHASGAGAPMPGVSAFVRTVSNEQAGPAR